MENEVVSQEQRSLVPITTPPEKLALVRQLATDALAKSDVRTLGVSTRWLTQQIIALDLANEDVETLVALRSDFKAKLPHAIQLLKSGLAMEEIWGCYVIRDQGDVPASLVKLAKLSQYFSEFDLTNEGAGEALLWAHEIIAERYFWVHYVDQTVDILCAIARDYQCATIEAAVMMIDSRAATRDGVRSEADEEEDEILRHREAYESARDTWSPW